MGHSLSVKCYGFQHDIVLLLPLQLTILFNYKKQSSDAAWNVFVRKHKLS